MRLGPNGSACRAGGLNRESVACWQRRRDRSDRLCPAENDQKVARNGRSWRIGEKRCNVDFPIWKQQLSFVDHRTRQVTEAIALRPWGGTC